MVHIPIISNWVGKINHVQQILATPCSITPQVFVGAFFAAVPTLLWTLFKPDLVDAEFSRGGRPHHRRRRPRFRIGGAIEGERSAEAGFKQVLFDIGELAQRVGWYLLIVDAGIDHAVNWMSLAYKWSGCQLPGQCVTGVFDTTDELGGASGWIGAATWQWHGECYGAAPSIPGVFVFGGTEVSQSISMTAVPAGGTQGRLMGVRIVRLNLFGDPTVICSSGNVNDDGGFSAHSFAPPFTSGDSGTYRAQVRVEGGYVRIPSSAWTVQAGPIGGATPLAPDP